MSPKTVIYKICFNILPPAMKNGPYSSKNRKIRFMLFYGNYNGYVDIFYILVSLFSNPILQFKSV